MHYISTDYRDFVTLSTRVGTVTQTYYRLDGSGTIAEAAFLVSATDSVSCNIQVAAGTFTAAFPSATRIYGSQFSIN